MCSQAMSSGTRLLEGHGVQKELNPNLRPEKQHTMSKQGKVGEAVSRSRKCRIEKEKT